MSMNRCLPALLIAMLPFAGQVRGQSRTAEAQAVLSANCVPCHNARTQSSGLAMDSREALLKGGSRGPALQPGSPDTSLLLKAVEHSGTVKMPPGRRLSGEQVATIREWIREGAPWAGSTKNQPSKLHWSFQPPRAEKPPAVRKAEWIRNPIDNFILAKLDQEGLEPSAEADRYKLLRRVSLDITGLPPTRREILDFVSDAAPNAYEKVVDRLLASPHYGERWGRHWLDLARYADSDGYTIDAPRKMWKYRDWVLQALNRDMPFDRFVVEQIAGDLLPNPTVDQLIATGFHRNTPINSEGGIDFEQYRVEAVADRVATTGSVFLGLTIGCARCHDHKYDPISHREFYQLFAFFNSTDEISSESERRDILRPLLEVPSPEEQARREAHRAQVAALSRELASHVKYLSTTGNPRAYRDPGLKERLDNYRALQRRAPEITTALIMRELPSPRQTYIHLGGDFVRKGPDVVPGVPAILSPQPVTGTRLDLARWLVSPTNPLTARVTVNRFWQTYFGQGLVDTESDFGLQGSPPSHPQLLDWLALRFIDSGWSQRAVHKLIVMSATYRQSSTRRPELDSKDPGNRLLARQSRIRLEAEILRDSALGASGLLHPAIGGPSVFPPIPEGAMAVTQVKRDWKTATGKDRYRRGIYTFFYRSAPHPGLALFDAPDGVTTCTRRVRSNTPLQALTLLNDAAYIEFARALARQILGEEGFDASRIESGFLAVLGRRPSVQESERIGRFIALQRDEFRSDPASAAVLVLGQQTFDSSPGGTVTGEPAVAPKQIVETAVWTSVARVLFNLDDFVTRE